MPYYDRVDDVKTILSQERDQDDGQSKSLISGNQYRPKTVLGGSEFRERNRQQAPQLDQS